MSGRIIAIVLEKGWGFSGVLLCPPCGLLGLVSNWPWCWRACPPAYYHVRIIRRRLLEAGSSAVSGQAWFKPVFKVSRVCPSPLVSRTLNKGVSHHLGRREAVGVFITLLKTAPNLTLKTCFLLEFSNVMFSG